MTEERADDPEDPLAWTREYTPVLQSLADEHREDRPLEGYTVAVASHLEASTGVLIDSQREYYEDWERDDAF